jgi:hypothetical protein
MDADFFETAPMSRASISTAGKKVNGMKSENIDHTFEKRLRQIVRDSSLTDAEIAEIADSPRLRWAVKRDLDSRAAKAMPWPPTKWLARLMTFGVPAAVAVAVLIGLGFWMRSGDDVSQRIDVAVQTPPAVVETQVPSQIQVEPAANAINEPVRYQRKKAVSRRSVRPGPILTTGAESSEAPVNKTEFIALSYARNPDSGQIVRVKVPSSMLVTLGLVQTVEKPTNLIDAEVLVGDDGLTRAIRFIR